MKNIKEEIIKILGKDHLTPIEFTAVFGFYGLYTYQGGVYVFKDGEDIDFEDLMGKEQEKILDTVLSKNWKLNKSLQ